MTSKTNKRLTFLLGIILSFFIGLCFLSFFTTSIRKNSIPDFCQAKVGNVYCGPTSVSNILIYLDKNNFQNLLPIKNPSSKDELSLIKLLGSDNYMKTSLETGTEPFDLMKGLEKYVTEHSYNISLSWKGWSEGGDYSMGPAPDPTWIKCALDNGSNSVLQIGWYKFDKKKNFYKRIGGHYVTVVGFKGDKVIIHDPSVRSGDIPKDELCTFLPIKDGTLSSWQSYKKRDAKGFYKIDGLKLKEGANCAIVDGAVVFKITNGENVKYFAYGSNLSTRRMSVERGIKILERNRATLNDYELRFNKTARDNPQEGKGNIVRAKNMVVEGIIYDISESDLKKLDGFEGCPIGYGRDIVMVRLENGSEVNAFVYVAKPSQVRNDLKPSMEYLNYLLEGKDFLSMHYYEMLKATKTLD